MYVQVVPEGGGLFRACGMPQTDASGAFTTEPLAPGDYAIFANSPGFVGSGWIRGSLDELIANPVEIKLRRKE